MHNLDFMPGSVLRLILGFLGNPPFCLRTEDNASTLYPLMFE